MPNKPLPQYEQPNSDPQANWAAGDAYIDSLKPDAPTPPQAGVMRTLGDVGIKLAQGTVDLGQSVVGLGDLATGGLVGKGLRKIGYDPEATNQFLGDYLSDSQKAADQKVNDAQGFVDTVTAAIQNPRSILGGVAESIPGIYAGMGIQGAVAARIAARAAMGTLEGMAASRAAIAAGRTATEAAEAALATDAGKAAAQAALDANGKSLMALGSGVEGAQSAGQIADQAQGQGRSWSDYAAPSIAAGLGTAAISYGSGRLMGDAKTQIATGANSVAVKGSKVAQIGKEFLHEGVMQELPQSMQEQYFTNIANGEDDPMKGVANAGATGMLAGGVMGVGFGALGHGHADHADHAQHVAPMVLDDTGVLSQAANAGQAALAQKINGQQDLSQPLDYTPTPIPQQQSQPLSLINNDDIGSQQHPNAIDYTAPESVVNTAGLENLQKYSSMGTPYDLGFLQDAVPRMNANGTLKSPLTIIPHAEGGYTVAPTKSLTPSIQQAVAHLQTASQPGTMDSAMPPITHQALQDMATRRAMYAPTGFGEHAQMESLLASDRDRAAVAQVEQSRLDAMQQQAEAEAQQRQQDQDIKAADARTAAAYQRQADANRAALRDQVLNDSTIPPEQKKGAFAAALKQDGYINPRLTDADHAAIDDAIAPVPNSPNELTNAVPEKLALTPAPKGKPQINTDAVDTAIAQGMRLKAPGSNVLHKPGSSKIFRLNDAQRAYYDRVIKKANAPLTALDQGAHRAATSPLNSLPEPTEAQKEAGNYAKGHVRFGGMDITIENPEGSTRSGIARDGTAWQTTMQQHYGYIRGTVGMDKDHIDVFIGKNQDSQKVFVVDQIHPETGKPDEHKVLLGFDTMQQAREAYQSNYDAGWNGGNRITETSLDQLKRWLNDGNTKKPFAQNAPAGSTVADMQPAVPPGLERARRLKAERDAAKASADEHDRGMEVLAEKWAEQDREKSAREAEKPVTPLEQPAEEKPEAPQDAHDPVDIQLDDELNDAFSHLFDVLTDVSRAKLKAMGPYHTSADILPALSKVMEILVRKGARSLAQAVTQAAKLMRSNPKLEPLVDEISPRQWKAAYNAIAEYHDGTDSELHVAGTTTADMADYTASKDTPGKRASTAPEHAKNTGAPLDRTVKYDKTADPSNVTSHAPVDESVVPLTMNKADFEEITDEWANLFADPDKKTVTAHRVKEQPVMSVDAAHKLIDGWKQHAAEQGKEHRSENSNKTVLSLFDLSGEWSKPWKDAGYNVITMDIQTGQDVHDFSVEYFTENYDLSDVYAILAATPCTDFASSGSRHFAAKDADGRTEASKQLVFQTMRTIEYFRPAIWALENPVGRIEDLTGLPKARMTFDPNHFGDPYTKKTMMWGNFNAELPTAHVEPTEGSKMWSQYGGKSQATKNARSVTPEGFAYAFFMANNYIDMPAEQKLTAQYPEASGAVKQALKAGVSEQRIHNLIGDHYGNYEYEDARNALAKEVSDVTANEPASAAPALSTQDLNRLSVKDMTDEQLLRAKDELPKRAKPIAKEIDRRGLDEKSDAEPARDEQDEFEQRRADASVWVPADVKTYSTVDAKTEWDSAREAKRQMLLGRINLRDSELKRKGWADMSPDERKSVKSAMDEDFYSPTWYVNSDGKRINRMEDTTPKKTAQEIASETAEKTWEAMSAYQRFSMLLQNHIDGPNAEQGKFSKWSALSPELRERLIGPLGKSAEAQKKPEKTENGKFTSAVKGPIDPNAIAARYAQVLAEGREGISTEPSDFHRNFGQDIANNNGFALKWITNGLNDKAKKVFAEFTGVKLPKAQGKAWEALKEWAGVTPEQDKARNEAKQEALRVKRTAADAETAERDARNQQFRTSDEDPTIITGKEMIDRQIAEGFTSIQNISKSGVPKYALVNEKLDRFYPLDKVGKKYAEVALSRLGEKTDIKTGNVDRLQTNEQAAAEQAENERELADAKAKGQTVVSDDDAAHLLGKDKPATPALPEKSLTDMRVNVDVHNADTGKTSTMSVPADVAMRDVINRISALEDLIACMKG